MTKAELISSLDTLDILLIIFGVVVAIGVAGEAIVGLLHWRRSNQLQNVQNSENLEQQKEIARLTKQAEEDHLARVKIEQRISARHVSSAQHRSFVQALLPYKGT